MALKFLIDSNIDTFLEKDQQKKEKHFDIVCEGGGFPPVWIYLLWSQAHCQVLWPKAATVRPHMFERSLFCFLGPRGPFSLRCPSVRPPLCANFFMIHKWAVTLVSGRRDPFNRIFHESPWCQVSNLNAKYKHMDKHKTNTNTKTNTRKTGRLMMWHFCGK